MKRGFSLIEAVIVLAVLAIVLAIGTPNFLRWRASSTVRQAAEQLAADLDRQRAEAKRLNAVRTVTFSDEADTYTVAGVTKRLPDRVTLTLSGATSVSFLPPYGTTTTTLPLRSFSLGWDTNPDIRRSVRVVGVTGKVIVQ